MNGIPSLSRERRRPLRGNPHAIVEVLEARAVPATVTVNIVGFSFNPDPVTIHVGDTVEWDWQSNDHSSTSVKGSAEQWDSGVHSSGFTFDHTFNTAGTFAYYCTIHGKDNGDGTASGMSSKVVVLPAGTPTPTPSPTPTPTPTAAPLAATGQAVRVKASRTFHKSLARFSEPGTSPGNFTILIDWGDQSGPTSGQVHRQGKGRYTALGTHRYLTPGVFQVMVMIRDSAGQEADVMSMMTVKGKPPRAHR